MKRSLHLIAYLLLFTLTGYGVNEKISVTETTVKIAALTTEELYFGFAAGDQLILNFELVKGKDLKEIEVFEYPGASIFMDYKVTSIKDKSININNEGVYKFSFKNTSMGVRIVKLKIERIPAPESTEDFNSTVYWKEVRDTSFYTVQEKYLKKRDYVPTTILPTADYYINSGSNATFKGGKSRIVFPFTLPKNTVEWYYQFSATRNKDEINATKNTFDLTGELTRLIDQTGVLEFGVDALTQPPGANYCDLYLLDYDNSSLFMDKVVPYSYFTIGTRENMKSGLVKINGGAGQSYYLGIKNPDSMHGIHVAIEVVAIVLNE